MSSRQALALVPAVIVGAIVLLSSSDGDLTVDDPTTGDALHPAGLLLCSQYERCADLRAEVNRWAARTMPTRGTPTDVSLHYTTDDAGHKIVEETLGVVRFADSFRVAVIVKCGIGIDLERCEAWP